MEAPMNTYRPGILLHGSHGPRREKVRSLAWNGARDDLSLLAESFPTLRRAPGVRPFDSEALDAWASGPAPSSGAFHAAAFVLNVFNCRAPWAVGRFDVVAAMSAWDAAHRQAFLAWARAPWTA
ncbi:MAG: hypothetical protein KF878_17390 [Planctomycetes bacterium]|nr:hypothetical protein [Planctomycetota bacterium]